MHVLVNTHTERIDDSCHSYDVTYMAACRLCLGLTLKHKSSPKFNPENLFPHLHMNEYVNDVTWFWLFPPSTAHTHSHTLTHAHTHSHTQPFSVGSTLPVLLPVLAVLQEWFLRLDIFKCLKSSLLRFTKEY